MTGRDQLADDKKGERLISDSTLHNLINLAAINLNVRLLDVSRELDMAGITSLFWERIGEHQDRAQSRRKSDCKFFVIKREDDFYMQNVPEGHYHIHATLDYGQGPSKGQHLSFYVDKGTGKVSGHLGTSLLPLVLLNSEQLEVIRRLTCDPEV